VPCLVDGATTVWDSLAIAEYLAERHPGVWPEDAKARAWSRCAAAEMHSGFSNLRNICSMSVGVRVRLPEIPVALQQDLRRIDELWQEGLKRHGGPFLGGQSFSAVDAFYCPVAFRIQTYGLEVSGASMAYGKRLLALASMQAWYADALKEPWRDSGHEDHIKHAGTWLEDNRHPA